LALRGDARHQGDQGRPEAAVHAVERLGAAVLLRRALAGTRTRERGLERVRQVPHLAAKVAVVSFLAGTQRARRLTAAARRAPSGGYGDSRLGLGRSQRCPRVPRGARGSTHDLYRPGKPRGARTGEIGRRRAHPA